MVRGKVLILILAALPLARGSGQEPGQWQVQSLAQSPYDDRHPYFCRGEDIGVTEVLWLAYDCEVEPGNTEIFLRRLGSEEGAWAESLRLTFDPGADQNPAVELVGDSALVVWESDRRGNWDLMYSMLGTVGWSSPDFITTDDANEQEPALASLSKRVSGRLVSSVLLVFCKDGVLHAATFCGGCWQLLGPVAPPEAGVQARPFLLANAPDDRFLALWQGNGAGNWDIFLSWWKAGETAWAPPMVIACSPLDETNVVMARGFVWESIIVWQTNHQGQTDLFGTSADLSGDSVSLQPPVNLTETPYIDEVDPYTFWLPYGCTGEAACAWVSQGEDSSDIFFSWGPDGFRWPVSLIHGPPLERQPVISPMIVSSQTAWVAWESLREGQWDIIGVPFYVETGAVGSSSAGAPASVRLVSNYPNPFKAPTTISYRLPRPGPVVLEIYNTVGQKVRTLVNEPKAAGAHTVPWDGRDEQGREMPGGVYLCRLFAGSAVATKKLVLTR